VTPPVLPEHFVVDPDVAHPVVLLAGPSGSGKSHLAALAKFPVLRLDDFYRDGDDPALPMHPTLGIADWDDPRAWNVDAAFDCLMQIARTGACDLPVYDIGASKATGTHHFTCDGRRVFVAEGLFAGELVQRCTDAKILADAIVLARSPWKNYVRRMARDFVRGRKPPKVIVERGWNLLKAEPEIVVRQVESGCRPLDADGTRARLTELAD
jgi:uridine kinase